MDKFRVELGFPGCGVGGIAVGCIQHQGEREYQEDNYGFSSASPTSPEEPAQRFTAVVADGMGGLSSGAFVSDYVVKKMVEADIGMGEIPVHEQLCRTVRRISGEIAAGGSRGGSTLAAVVCVPEGVYFCSVGDSRIYMLRGGVLIQLTEDGDYFSVLLERVISGGLSFTQAVSDPDRDALSQYMGSGTFLTPDRNIMPLVPQPGDRLLICSDGVYNALSSDELLQSLTLSAGAASEDIFGRILARGYTNQDNFTAVVLEFLPGEEKSDISRTLQKKVQYDSCDFSSCTGSGGCERNEDSFFTGNGMFAVADGLGGHKNGAKASAAAVNYLSANAGGDYSPERINELFEGANKEVLSLGGGMTTIAAAFAKNGVFTYGNVGDSRVYYLRGGRIIARTTDHSVCQAAVELGQINPEQIRGSEDRAGLLKALGSVQELNLDQGCDPIEIQPGDAFIVCSDGFWEYVHEHEMEADLLKSSSSAEWLSHMLKRHLLKSGDRGDNYTAICGIFTDQPEQEKLRTKRRFNARLLIAAGIAALMLCALAVVLGLISGSGGGRSEPPAVTDEMR